VKKATSESLREAAAWIVVQACCLGGIAGVLIAAGVRLVRHGTGLNRDINLIVLHLAFLVALAILLLLAIIGAIVPLRRGTETSSSPSSTDAERNGCAFVTLIIFVLWPIGLSVVSAWPLIALKAGKSAIQLTFSAKQDREKATAPFSRACWIAFACEWVLLALAAEGHYSGRSLNPVLVILLGVLALTWLRIAVRLVLLLHKAAASVLGEGNRTYAKRIARERTRAALLFIKQCAKALAITAAGVALIWMIVWINTRPQRIANSKAIEANMVHTKRACMANLRVIAVAKENAAQHGHYSDNAEIPRHIISRYLSRNDLARLRCPNDGRYTIGIGTNCPSCSIHGVLQMTAPEMNEAHSLDEVPLLNPKRPAAPTRFMVQPIAGQEIAVAVGPAATIALCWCPATTDAGWRVEHGGADSFIMGSPEHEEQRGGDETPHRVRLTNGFWTGKHEVTQRQWLQVMGGSSHVPGIDEEDIPVGYVSWIDVQSFLEKLNLMPVRIVNSGSDRSLAPSRQGRFRLPTEAEWEYACRAGTTTPFNCGSQVDSSMANFNGDYPYGGASICVNWKKAMPSGSYSPNAYGICDMHGNVYEWCQDWYVDYAGTNMTNPQGASSGTGRVIRGGAWNCRASSCRSASRRSASPSNRSRNLGFRVVFVSSAD